jgi:recombination protein RecT
MERTMLKGGMIQSAQAQKVKKASPAEMMRKVASSTSIQEILTSSLKDNAGSFTASIIELYSSDGYLQRCDAGSVMREALKAVSLKLPVNKQLGFAYIIPRRNKGVWEPMFQIGYKGLIQLAMRTGAYRYINAGEVYQGEYRGQDKLTGEVDLSGEAESEEIIGYFAYIETLNGFKKALYWPKARLIKHVSMYSDSYKSGNQIWTKNFTEMATKTVLKYLLSHWGVMSVEMLDAYSKDGEEVTEMADEQISAPEEQPLETSGREVEAESNVDSETIPLSGMPTANE